MEIRNNNAMHSNTNFGMAFKLGKNTTPEHLRNYVLERARFKDEDVVIKGLDKLIKDQANNEHCDIKFVHHSNINDSVYLVPKTATAKAEMNPEGEIVKDNFVDEVSIMTKLLTNYTKRADNVTNKLKKAWLKLQINLKERYLSKRVEKNPKMSLPAELVRADYNATILEKEYKKQDKQLAMIQKSLSEV